MTKIRKPYERHDRAPTLFDGPSRTKQSFKNECDINTIMKKYQKTGMVTHVTERRAQYADLPPPIEYQEALHLVQDANDLFASLPASMRTRFENSPEKYLGFLQDPANMAELVTLGLANPPAVLPEETPASGTPDATPTPTA